MDDKILYTFACLYAGDEECEYIPYLIPTDEKDPKGYFETMTADRKLRSLWYRLVLRYYKAMD